MPQRVPRRADPVDQGVGREVGDGDLSRFLWTRGLCLILLELTVVRLGFFFNVKYDVVLLLVFWALGLSMIALAGLVRLPYRAILGFSVALIVVHNAFDGVRAQSFGSLGWLWNVLHQPGLLTPGPPAIILAYPIVPWIGVMALGFCAGRLYRLPDDERRKTLMRIGVAATLAFVVVRGINIYGDPRPWAGQSSLAMTVVSFLNCTKYPPSLSFLLMTLGPAMIFLGLAPTHMGHTCTCVPVQVCPDSGRRMFGRCGKGGRPFHSSCL